MPEFKIASGGDVAPGQGRTVRAAGREFALLNVDGELIAIDDACPHMRASLSGGEVKGRTVTCSWHGWQFDLDTGRCLGVEWARVRRYPLRLEGGEVYLVLEPEPEAEEPEEEPLPEIVWKRREE
jgi:nitrite reductase/ring-hydroxylating ferredoxin subunit